MQQRGLISTRSVELTGRASGAQVVHKWRKRVARAMQVHADAQVAPRGSEGAGTWRAYGLVSPG